MAVARETSAHESRLNITLVGIVFEGRTQVPAIRLFRAGKPHELAGELAIQLACQPTSLASLAALSPQLSHEWPAEKRRSCLANFANYTRGRRD